MRTSRGLSSRRWSICSMIRSRFLSRRPRRSTFDFSSRSAPETSPSRALIGEPDRSSKTSRCWRAILSLESCFTALESALVRGYEVSHAHLDLIYLPLLLLESPLLVEGPLPLVASGPGLYLLLMARLLSSRRRGSPRPRISPPAGPPPDPAPLDP